jgi:hypothetical protein
VLIIDEISGATGGIAGVHCAIATTVKYLSWNKADFALAICGPCRLHAWDLTSAMLPPASSPVKQAADIHVPRRATGGRSAMPESVTIFSDT